MHRVAVRCQSKNIILNRSMVPGHHRPAQLIQVECMSCLCSLYRRLDKSHFITHSPTQASGKLEIKVTWKSWIKGWKSEYSSRDEYKRNAEEGEIFKKEAYSRRGGDIHITGILFSLEGDSRLRTFLQNVYYQKRTGGYTIHPWKG